MGKPKAPKPADPKVTASAQTAQNIGTAIANSQLNNVNQVTPFGDLTYNQTGSYEYTDPNNGDTYDIPTYTATQELSPQQQEILNRTNAAEINLAGLAEQQSGMLQNHLGEAFDPTNLPDRGDVTSLNAPDFTRLGAGPQLVNNLGPAGDITESYSDNFEESRGRVEDALFSRLAPQFERDREALETRLASQGITIGSQAYNEAIDELSRTQTDARFQAVLAGGQEQSRLTGLEANRATFENQAQQQGFNQNVIGTNFTNAALQQGFQNDITGAGFNNQVGQAELAANQNVFDAANRNRSAALQEQFATRGQPINEITALLSGSQVQQPNFVNTQQPTIPTTDFAGIQANYDQQRLAAWQSQNANRQSLFGGLLGLGGSLIASDKTVKTDIKKIAKGEKGKPSLYEYRYKGEPKNKPKHVGLIAQEVEKVKPDAVVTTPAGLKMIDYGAM